MPTQKIIKKTKKIKIIFLLKIILVLIKIKNNKKKDFIKSFIKNLKVIKEIL